MSLNPQDLHKQLMAEAPFSMRYQAGEEVSKWQEKAREKLGELLGWPFEKPADDRFTVEYTQEQPGYTDTRILFDSEPGCTVACHLWTPKGSEGKLPLVICLQGHSKGMHISMGRPVYPGDEEIINGGDRDFARQIVARGYAALTLEQRGFGERGGTKDGPGCYQVVMQALLLGRTLIGERCWDISRSIDMIADHFPQIDAGKVAVMGNSGGGTAVIYAAAMDQRIAAAMPSCAFCGFQASIGELHHCSCNYVPGIMKEFDMGDLAGLIAPRPLVIVNGEKDMIFPLASAKDQEKIARRVYEAAGAGDMLRHVIGPEGHRFYAALAWPVFDELTNW
ncbi:MAG: acetylxylan esterase [Clostridia bacterium]|nr:acetylxylan esterase [Clostridia bacterium]